ncbi:hypothetical protein H3146_07260 [Streptomyces sp. OF3]|uniref:Uncharacterized protein n=1 Tax=Streptomyces alkaliterrae TaxID=2213162 RepID=A0A7W3ZLX6_9ACTN|nr:hypothetical protein [Streptomyces alkaliterrae]MBB1253168.1 hypothetical protein [Streptomyces alkaliterrae]
MTWRRLRVLIQHLPPESHTMTALRNAMPAEELTEAQESGDATKGRWSQAEQLLATIADRVAALEHITVLAHSDGKGRKPEPPKPIPRPGVQDRSRKPRVRLTEQGAERLFQLINGGA